MSTSGARPAYGFAQPPMGKNDHIDARDILLRQRRAYQTARRVALHAALHRHRRFDSTVAEIGDRDWHAFLDAHDAVVRAQLVRFRGREVSSAVGFFAMFDGPQRAIRCAMAIRDAVRSLGFEGRAGLHTGECEVRGDDIGGDRRAHRGASEPDVRARPLDAPWRGRMTCWRVIH